MFYFENFTYYNGLLKSTVDGKYNILVQWTTPDRQAPPSLLSKP